MSTIKDLEWFVPHPEKRQNFICQLESCETMNKVLINAIKPMIADEKLGRVNVFTAGKKAFFEAIKEHLHLEEGGASFSTYYRRFTDMIDSVKHPDLLNAVNRALESKGKEIFNHASIPLPTGKTEGETTIKLPLTEGIALQIVAKICVLECRLVEMRNFDGAHTDDSMCDFELLGEPNTIAKALRLFSALADDEELDKRVRLHYIYKSVDRRNQTLQQVINMAENS